MAAKINAYCIYIGKSLPFSDLSVGKRIKVDELYLLSSICYSFFLAVTG